MISGSRFYFEVHRHHLRKTSLLHTDLRYLALCSIDLPAPLRHKIQNNYTPTSITSHLLLLLFIYTWFPIPPSFRYNLVVSVSPLSSCRILSFSRRILITLGKCLWLLLSTSFAAPRINVRVGLLVLPKRAADFLLYMAIDYTGNAPC